MKLALKLLLLCFLFFCLPIAQAQKNDSASIDSMKKALTNLKPDSTRIRAIYAITNAYLSNLPDSAIAYARTGLSLAIKLKWQKGIAPFYNVIGNIYSDRSNYAMALKYYQDSYQINKKLNNKRNMASNLNNMGSQYQRQGNYVKSLDYTFKALLLAEDAKADDYAAVFTTNIARIYFAQKDYARSLYYSSKALKSLQKLGDKNGIAGVYTNMANVYHEQKILKQANIFYDKALILYREVNNVIDEASVLSQIGLLYEEDPDKKLGYLLQAQRLFDKVDPMYTMSLTNMGNIGEIYSDILINNKLKSGKKFKNIPSEYAEVKQKALTYLTKAVELSKKTGDTETQSAFAADLAHLQENLGNYQSALQNYKIAQSIDDSMYSQASKNKIASLNAQYAFQRKEDQYKQDKQIAGLQMKQIKLYAAFIILLITALLVYFLNRSRIKQLRLKNELQQKEAEEKTRELLHRNKLSESELKAIRAQMNPHFIFNVLNSIESYILENDSKTASRLVQKFASLSRLILENSTQSLVAAEREWKALKLYTELEAMRFNNQFTYTFYQDPLIDLTALMLPPMLIQPLIENAIHHGVRNSIAVNNLITVKLEQTESDVIFTIEDNGIGMEESAKIKNRSSIKSKSMGLSTIRERIEIINQMNNRESARFEINSKQPGNDQGTIAVLTLPKMFRSN